VQLSHYGANIFVVDLLGIALLREFAPLLTAIIMAGRTGSAYTAQLGTMKLNQEFDALQTMGLSPMHMLVLPKIVALLIALPLLTVVADFVGVLGGMIMAKSMLQVSFIDFLSRFSEVVSLKNYVIGLIKTPVFALLIATIGCYQGFQVHASATSVGQRTTTSVVQSIFAIIAADAAFSILFSYLGI
jgi:phospholipid/cholesterol/gamma-HCH transport system permease protein